jgi:hypothetical protein
MGLCSQVLSALGVDIADDEADNDPESLWERREITRFHDAVTTLFGCPASSPFFDLQLPPAWWAEPCLRAPQREMISLLRTKLAVDQPFGFTEPRAASFLPLWNKICRELRLAPRLVLCLRNPAQIARALAARHGDLDPDLVEYHWLAYMVEVFRHVHDHPLCLVQFEDWFEDAAKNVIKISEFLRINGLQADAAFDNGIAQIIDPRRHHEPVAGLEPRQPLIRSFYRLTREYADDLGGREQIGLIVDHFTTFQELQRPLQRESLRVLDALVAAERELVALRAELEQADAQTAENDAAWRAEATKTDAAWRALYAEAQRRMSAHAAGEAAVAEQVTVLNSRIEEVTAVLAADRIELAAVRQANNALEQTDAQLRAVLAEREVALAVAADEAQASAVRAAASEELSKMEKTALRAALGAAEQWAATHAAAEAASAAEIVALRQAANVLEQSNAELRAALAEREAAFATAANEAQANAARAAASEELSEAEKTELRAMLGEAEHQAAAHAAAAAELVALRQFADTLQKTNAELRTALAEREAAVAAVASEENKQAPRSARRGQAATWLREQVFGRRLALDGKNK